jgi:hypothetical protein
MNPLTAMMIEQKGFDGVYISSAVLSADLGLPDIGLTTLTEVSQRGHQIARVTELPSIIDIDTGFGEPMSAARTVQVIKDMGISGCHLEDQENPKRCGHLDNKSVLPAADVVKKSRPPQMPSAIKTLSSLPAPTRVRLKASTRPSIAPRPCTRKFHHNEQLLVDIILQRDKLQSQHHDYL